MPLISSGTIYLGASASTTATNSAGDRLGYANGGAISMNDTAVRGLAEVSTTSGVYYSMASLLGKPSWAYTSNYDCSSFTGWTKSVDYDSGGSARYAVLYGSPAYHWQMRADGNLVPYIYQTRRLDIANTFDIQFDVMSNTSVNPVQIQIGADSNLANGGGFRYNTTGLIYASFSSSTHIGTDGAALMTWFNVCNNPPGTNRISLWTRLRFVGTRSGTTWSGTVSAISLAPADSGTVLGTASFSFTNAGQYIVLRSYANADGGGEACFIDSVWVSLD